MNLIKYYNAEAAADRIIQILDERGFCTDRLEGVRGLKDEIVDIILTETNPEYPKFKKEFDHIRHGNYFDFVNLVDAEIPTIVSYKNGEVIVSNEMTNTDFDFESLAKSCNSLTRFYLECFKEFGDFSDLQVSDETYKNVVMFEIGLRMHANNHRLLKDRENLIDVIDKLCSHRNISKQNTLSLHQGRKFLNMIKHFHNQFPTWKEGQEAFDSANQTLSKLQLTVF
jgi:hypothetical protein